MLERGIWVLGIKISGSRSEYFVKKVVKWVTGVEGGVEILGIFYISCWIFF